MVELHIGMAGLGVNTVAYIIKCNDEGIVFDKILFADPGKENPETYKYIPIFNKWLLEQGQPEITVLYNVNKHGEFIGLYQDCLNTHSLPSIVYGFKTCSQKYKKHPIDKYLNNLDEAIFTIAQGGCILKYFGYDADESHRTHKNHSTDKVKNVYKLVDENLGRFECIQIIIDAGLPLPPKSSCTFCPSMKPWEIIELYENNRKEYYDAITMERNAELTHIKGLGRDWSWWDLIVAYKYIKMLKRANVVGVYIPLKIQKLINKIHNSRPVDYEQLSKDRNDPVKQTCDLFKQNIAIPCDCMN